MTDTAEIQVAPDSTGKKVRTLTLTEPSAVDASGNAVADLARHQQVVSLADRRGDLAGRIDQEALTELRMIRELLETISLKLS